MAKEKRRCRQARGWKRRRGARRAGGRGVIIGDGAWRGLSLEEGAGVWAWRARPAAGGQREGETRERRENREGEAIGREREGSSATSG